jgi:3-phosphoshikimate 1-carboxyvinyltransferase
MKLVVRPTRGCLHGVVRIPPSKYHLHRALIMASLAQGTSHIKGTSAAAHIRDTIRSLTDFGITTHREGNSYKITGGRYRPRNGTIRVGNSGSTLQFLLGLGSRSEAGAVVFTGNHLLRRRPIGPLLEALSEIGIRWEAADSRLPVKIFPGLPRGGRVRVAGTLSQWISGLLMLAPLAEHDTIVEAIPPLNEINYILLTIRMLKEFGIEVNPLKNGHSWSVAAGQKYRPCSMEIEADLSSAAFLLILCALHPADVTLTGIRDEGNHPEGRVISIMREMGLPMQVNSEQQTVRIVHDGISLRAMQVDMRTIPDLLPILCVMAAAAKGRTTLTNVGPCRLKESNRVKAMLQLRKMGVSIEEKGDTLTIEGGSPIKGASISSHNDHRVEMAFAIAGTLGSGATELTYPNAYKFSYPEFLNHVRALGVDICVEQRKEELQLA